MSNYSEFIEIIESKTFWEDDAFLSANSVLLDFDSNDWDKLKDNWVTFETVIKDKAVVSLAGFEGKLIHKIRLSDYLIDIGDIKESLNIFISIRAKEFTKIEKESYFQIALRLFKFSENVKLKKKIKQAIWATGNSNKFLKRFDLKDWEQVFNDI